MADKPKKQANAATAKSTNPKSIDASPIEAPKKRRILKNPETFRERAIKAAESNGKPKRAERLRSVGQRVSSPVINPVGKASRKVGSLLPFRILGKILRFIGKILVPSYLRNSAKELRLVSWPNFRLAIRLTYAVLVFAIVFGGVIALVDYGLDKVFKHILLK